MQNDAKRCKTMRSHLKRQEFSSACLASFGSPTSRPLQQETPFFLVILSSSLPLHHLPPPDLPTTHLHPRPASKPHLCLHSTPTVGRMRILAGRPDWNSTGRTCVCPPNSIINSICPLMVPCASHCPNEFSPVQYGHVNTPCSHPAPPSIGPRSSRKLLGNFIQRALLPRLAESAGCTLLEGLSTACS